MSAFIAALQAFPAAIALAREIWSYLVKVSGGDVAGFLLKSSDVFKQLNNAKTEADHAAAAKSIADLIAGLPPK